MKPLKSKSSEAKKRKRNNIIIGFVLIIVMFGSVFGVIINSFGNSGKSAVKYKGFKFTSENGRWKLNLGNYDFSFIYNPVEIEEIKTQLNYLDSYSGKPLYILSDFPEASSEIISNIGFTVLRVQDACIQGKSCPYEDYPVKTCNDNFIIIEEGNENSIAQDNNCVFIEGNSSNIIQTSDEFLFHILGVR